MNFNQIKSVVVFQCKKYNVLVHYVHCTVYWYKVQCTRTFCSLCWYNKAQCTRTFCNLQQENASSAHHLSYPHSLTL